MFDPCPKLLPRIEHIEHIEHFPCFKHFFDHDKKD